MKLYGHSQDLAAALPLIQRMRPPFWKAIDPDADSARRVAELGVRLIVRHYRPAPLDNASAFVADCAAQPWFPYAWAIETDNEPFAGQPVVPAWYVAFEGACVQQFAALGKACIVGNRGTGHDGYFVPGATYYGIHEYGWPDFLDQKPWHGLRYRSWFRAVLARNPNAKLLFTEMGVTQAVTGGPDIGWRSDGRSPRGFWDGVRRYMAELGQDRYVLGAFLFQVGGFPDWSTFEVLGTEIEELMVETVDRTDPLLGVDPAVEGRTVDEGEESVADERPRFVLGVQAEAERLRGLGIDVGEPLANERYLKNPDGKDILSLQSTVNGLFIYDPEGNIVHFFRAAGR